MANFPLTGSPALRYRTAKARITNVSHLITPSYFTSKKGKTAESPNSITLVMFCFWFLFFLFVAVQSTDKYFNARSTNKFKKKKGTK